MYYRFVLTTPAIHALATTVPVAAVEMRPVLNYG